MMSNVPDDNTDSSTAVTRFPLRRWAAGQVAAYKARKARDQSEQENAPQVNCGSSSGILMSELTPPVQSDKERGEGDSVNSRLHRLLRGEP